MSLLAAFFFCFSFLMGLVAAGAERGYPLPRGRARATTEEERSYPLPPGHAGARSYLPRESRRRTRLAFWHPCSGGVLRPSLLRQQLQRSQVRVPFDFFKHCGEPRKNAVWWPVFNDVSEGAGDANGYQLFERRGPRKCHVCCKPAELLSKKKAGTASEI